MNFRFGELFCGPGGLAFAAKSAKIAANGKQYSFSHAWATDYDKDTCATYRHNICPDKPKSVICSDIRKINFKKLKAISDIDALAFGFPCNDFSIVGEQKGLDGIYGPLYSYGIKALGFFQPKFFLAENVGGLRNTNDGKTFNKILRDLRQAGYVITPHLYKFEQYDVPQTRHRIIIIGIRNDLKTNFYVPAPTHITPVTCREAIQNPPIPKRVFTKAPTAELKPGQTDQDTLPPYDALDNILKAYVEQDLSLEEIAAMGFGKALVKRVIRMVDSSEYKRRQAPPGIKITPRALGKDRRMPITNRYGVK